MSPAYIVLQWFRDLYSWGNLQLQRFTKLMIFPGSDCAGDGAIFSRTDISVVLLMALCEPLFLIAPPAVQPYTPCHHYFTGVLILPIHIWNNDHKGKKEKPNIYFGGTRDHVICFKNYYRLIPFYCFRYSLWILQINCSLWYASEFNFNTTNQRSTYINH